MRKLIYAGWAAWLVAGVVLKILGLCSWWWALSAVWFPLMGVISIGFVFMLTSDVGAWMKKREEAKILPSCENCLFRKAVDMINKDRPEGQKTTCIGERMGNPPGKVCDYWQK